MSLSLAVTAGAAFNDQDKIVNEEAADACVALNIINGYTDGSYKPEGTITRAEACKMIAVALNGGETPTTSVKEVPSFTDIGGNWAEAFIEYCFAKGVVDGVGDGKFNPNGLLTGAQLAKMLLVALGYNADVEKYVGATWDLYVNVQANQDGIYDELSDLDPSDPLNRDDAAQMIYNTLNAKIINKTSTIDRTTGEVVYIYTKGAETLMEDAYGAIRVEGVVVANEYVDLGTTSALADGKTELSITNKDEFNLTGNTFNVSTGKDEIGKAVVLYVVPADNSKQASKATVIGCVEDVNNVLSVDHAYDKASDLTKALKDIDLKVVQATKYYQNGVSVSAISNVTTGYATQFIDNNDNGIVDIVLIDKVDLGEVTKYSTKNDGSITVSGTTYNDAADVVGFEDVAKDDYVLFAEVGGRLYVEKAETITGDLTDYSKQGNSSAVAALWIDDVKYDNSGAVKYPSALTSSVKYTNLDEEAVFYFDACGYIVAVDPVVETHYGLATYYNPTAHDADSITTVAKAQMYYGDNTNGIAIVDGGDAFQKLLPGNYAVSAQLGVYDYNDDDELVLDNTLSGYVDSGAFKYTSGNLLITAGSGNLQNGGKNVYMTDETIVYMVEAKDNIRSSGVDTVATYIGKENVPSFELSADYIVKYIVNSDNEVEAMAVIYSDLVTQTDNFLCVLDVISSSSDTKEVQVAVNNDIITVTVNSKASATITEGNLYEYAVVDGKYELKQITSDYAFGTIEKVNTNDKTLVLNEYVTEYSISNAEFYDVEDLTDAAVLGIADLEVGDTVTILTDANDSDIIVAVFVSKNVVE